MSTSQSMSEAELQALADRFPMRGHRGLVCGWYVVGPEPAAERLAGPFPTKSEARASAVRTTDKRLPSGRLLVSGSVASVKPGPVFTRRGTVLHVEVA